MKNIYLKRRQILQGLAGLPLAASPAIGLAAAITGTATRSVNRAEKEAWASAATQVNGDAGFIAGGSSATVTPAGFRGHGVVLCPDNTTHALMMARRPGYEGVIFDLSSAKELRRFPAPEKRQFQGHAVFSQDGQEIYVAATVDDFHDPQNGQGRICVFDYDSLKLVREFDSGGPEPHELLLRSDGVLVVANGGLMPSASLDKRTTLADRMASSLVLLNPDMGELISQHRLAEEKASIRHISLSADGSVVAALQVQRQVMSDSEPRPLVAKLTAQGEFGYLDAPDNLWLTAQDYMGSVVVDPLTDVAAVTTPKGNFAAFWHVGSGKLLGAFQMFDVCGLAVSQVHQCFVLSNSAGELRYVDPVTLKEHRDLYQSFPGVRFDNHMSQSVVLS